MRSRPDTPRRTMPASVAFDALPDLGTGPELVSRPNPSHLELRQISGLTAGTSFPLPLGTTHFGCARADSPPDSQDIGFTVQVDDAGTTTIMPAAFSIRLDGHDIDSTTVVDDAVIDVGNARFTIARRRLDTPRRRVSVHADQTIQQPVIPVPHRSQALDPEAFDAELRKRVTAARRVVTAQHRRSHPDPVEILSIAQNDNGQRWTRRSTDSDFCRVSIAHAERPWQPKFDNIGRIPNASAVALEDLRYLVASAVTADLAAGPLAIVGCRSARLAVTRQLLVSLATLTTPSDLEIAVLAEQDHASTWRWADAVPHTHGGANDAVPLLVVDGVQQLDDTLGGALIDSCGAGAVILADRVEDLTIACSMTMLLLADGTTTLINHHTGETIVGATPLGLTEERASEAATYLRQATLSTVQPAARADTPVG